MGASDPFHVEWTTERSIRKGNFRCRSRSPAPFNTSRDNRPPPPSPGVRQPTRRRSVPGLSPTIIPPHAITPHDSAASCFCRSSVRGGSSTDSPWLVASQFPPPSVSPDLNRETHHQLFSKPGHRSRGCPGRDPPITVECEAHLVAKSHEGGAFRRWAVSAVAASTA